MPNDIIIFRDSKITAAISAKYIIAISRLPRVEADQFGGGSFGERTKVEYIVRGQSQSMAVLVYDSCEDFQRNLEMWQKAVLNVEG